MIASHYADPLERSLVKATSFLREADDGAEVLAELAPGDTLRMLDNSRGWAWGYAGPDQRVGYVRSDSLAS